MTGTQELVPRVAQASAVNARISRLTRLAQHVVGGYLDLADALYAEHVAGLWQRARTPDGQPFASEESFWEEAVGIRRRTGYRLIALGRMLATLKLSTLDRAALAAVGLHKMDTLIPILEQQTSVRDAREWIDRAQAHSRQDLRQLVGSALGRPTPLTVSPGTRVENYLLNAMPDLETRQLATEFFQIGTSYVGSDNALAIIIAAMQEALGTWQAHAETAEASLDGIEVHEDTTGGP